MFLTRWRPVNISFFVLKGKWANYWACPVGEEGKRLLQSPRTPVVSKSEACGKNVSPMDALYTERHCLVDFLFGSASETR